MWRIPSTVIAEDMKIAIHSSKGTFSTDYTRKYQITNAYQQEVKFKLAKATEFLLICFHILLVHCIQ